jgi:HSP20 family protein
MLDIERAFEPIFGETWFRPALTLEAPAIDVYEENHDLVVKAEIPGLTKDEIDVSVIGNMLTVKGEKKKEEEINEKDYYRCERAFGAFARTVEFPVAVKTDNIKASFKDGVLEVRLPKTEEAKKNVVHVKVA